MYKEKKGTAAAGPVKAILLATLGVIIFIIIIGVGNVITARTGLSFISWIIYILAIAAAMLIYYYKLREFGYWIDKKNVYLVKISGNREKIISAIPHKNIIAFDNYNGDKTDRSGIEYKLTHGIKYGIEMEIVWRDDDNNVSSAIMQPGDEFIKRLNKVKDKYSEAVNND